MLLTIDIGNTNITLGLYQGETLGPRWRLATDHERMPDEYGLQILGLLEHAGRKPVDVTGVCLASVVPPLTGRIITACQVYLHQDPLIVDAGVRTGVRVRYEDPRAVGADRIVDAAAVIKLYGVPACVVDFGTATTFDYVSKKGEYMGGCITPGIVISSDALFDKASKLPRVELKRAKTVIAKDTVSSMQAGIMFGYAGLVDGIVDRMKAEIRSNPKVVATGGLAKIIAPETKSIDVVDEFLTLDGLRIIYERNK